MVVWSGAPEEMMLFSLRDPLCRIVTRGTESSNYERVGENDLDEETLLTESSVGEIMN